MHKVFSAASKVLIWLGLGKDNSGLARTTLHVLGEGFTFDHSTYEMEFQPSGNESVVLWNDSISTQADALWNNWAITFSYGSEFTKPSPLLSRPWFTRVWIGQEAFAASDDSIVMCGPAAISLYAFRNALQAITMKGLGTGSPDDEHNLACMTLAVSVFNKGQMSVLDMLERLRQAQCRKPQDKVYGCLGMMELADNSDFVRTIPTNYPNTVELFTQLCIQYLACFGLVGFLNHAGLSQRSRLGGPSWMPDWTADCAPLTLNLEFAVSHAVYAEAFFAGGISLHAKGVIAAKISHAETLDQTGEGGSGAIHSLAQITNRHIRSNDVCKLESFTFALGIFLRWHRVPSNRIAIYREDFKTLLSLIVSATGSMPPSVDAKLLQGGRDSFHIFIELASFLQTHHFPLIFTQDGRLGIGPAGTQPGDIIAAILGLDNLVVLRSAESPGRYRLVGPACLHGMNWGEALLRPLPDGTIVTPQEKTYLPNYHNTKSGETKFWDPRIEWNVLAARENESVKTIPAPIGEPKRKVPDSEYFIKYHGARVVTIELV